MPSPYQLLYGPMSLADISRCQQKEYLEASKSVHFFWPWSSKKKPASSVCATQVHAPTKAEHLHLGYKWTIAFHSAPVMEMFDEPPISVLAIVLQSSLAHFCSSTYWWATEGRTGDLLLYSNLHPKLAKLQGNHSCYQAFSTNPKLPQPLPSILPPRYHNHAIFTRLAFLSVQSVASGWTLPTAEWLLGWPMAPIHGPWSSEKRRASWWVEECIRDYCI